MSIEAVPGTNLHYYLIAYDVNGQERTDDPGGLISDQAIGIAGSSVVTDVFLISHGWKGDIKAAREQYNNWIAATAICASDITRAKARPSGFFPLIIGLHWPSLPFGGEEFEAQASSYSTAGNNLIQPLVDRYADSIANTPSGREALRTIFQAAMEDVAPSTLPDSVRTAYRTLNREAQLGESGVAAAPGADREQFDPDVAYQNGLDLPGGFASSAVSGLLSPLVQLSFWKMKDRARRFGEAGAFDLLLKLLSKSSARIHLMGHSFGCIVASAATAGPVGRILPRPIESLLLVQGALSLWSYCSSIPAKPDKEGYFRRLVTNRCVRGSIVTTQSEHDTAVGTLYPLAAGVAHQVAFAPDELPVYGGLGAFGVRGDGIDVVDSALLAIDQEYAFEAGKVYNLESSKVICNGTLPSGAHNDIAKPEVAHAMWSAALAFS